MSKKILFPGLEKKIKELKDVKISEERQVILSSLISFIQSKMEQNQPVLLNFICTHNSRRSQLGQVWAKAISTYFGIAAQCFSGGTEETTFHQNAIDALTRAGFRIEGGSAENQHIKIFYATSEEPLLCYSKIYDASENPSKGFAAVMTCSHADENCPFIPGADARIPLDYKDPKQFDGTSMVMEKYDERSDQIAAEMIYVFKSIK